MEVNWDEIQESVSRTLQELIRFDTTNPPGGETACATYVRDRLAAAGVEALLLEPLPGRGSAVGRLKGSGAERPLLLMSHLDVVPAEALRWTHPPFSGVVHDGFVWGRGAVDAKRLTAMHLETVLLIRRLGLPLKRDIIIAATADEEAGGVAGMRWLAEKHFDLVDAEYALNEGGGHGSLLGGRLVFMCQTAEKGGCPVTLRAHGPAGHASSPRRASAVNTLAAALDRLAHARLPYHLIPTVEASLRSLSEILPEPLAGNVRGLLDPATELRILDQLPDGGLAGFYRASLHNTATPTILRAGTRVNVIPSVAEADLDCRLLPGQTAEDLVAELRPYVGDEIEIVVSRSSSGIESDYRSPLFETIAQVVADLEPGAVTLPYMLPAGTDAKHLARKGVRVYGFAPAKDLSGQPNTGDLAHNHDERVSLENLRFGTRVLFEIVRRFCAA